MVSKMTKLEKMVFEIHNINVWCAALSAKYQKLLHESGVFLRASC
jgi:hypothetical protein